VHQRRLTPWPSGPVNVEHHVDSLLDLEYALPVGWTDRADIDCHALPRSVEQFMPVKKRRDTGLPFAGQQLQERCQVLGTDDLARQDAVEQVHIRAVRVWVVAFRAEGHDGPCGSGAVYEVERGAKEAGQGVGQSQPFVVRPTRRDDTR